MHTHRLCILTHKIQLDAITGRIIEKQLHQAGLRHAIQFVANAQAGQFSFEFGAAAAVECCMVKGRGGACRSQLIWRSYYAGCVEFG